MTRRVGGRHGPMAAPVHSAPEAMTEKGEGPSARWVPHPRRPIERMLLPREVATTLIARVASLAEASLRFAGWKGDAVEVGIRDLRDHLSRYLDRVEAGEEIVVTDRRRAVARVVPMSGARTIDRLIAEGRVTPAAQRRRSRPEPLRTAGSVSDLVAEQRR